jgi:hypothetical protein
MRVMTSDAERALRAIRAAATAAEGIRVDLSEGYLALIHMVEALPENQTGADKTARVAAARPKRPIVSGPLDPRD